MLGHGTVELNAARAAAKRAASEYFKEGSDSCPLPRGVEHQHPECRKDSGAGEAMGCRDQRSQPQKFRVTPEESFATIRKTT
jgi:hypothetical protein